MLFVQVPDAKTVKNRAHLDLEPSDRSRDEEVARVLELGALLVDDQRRPDGTGWVVLGDPEGNEFCVLRSAEERAATQLTGRSITKGATKTIAGQPALGLVDTDGSTLWVATTGDPLPILISSPASDSASPEGTSGGLAFSDWNEVADPVVPA